MNKGRKSVLNAIAALIQMAVTSIVALVFNRTILSVYGSDYNGINSTISQLINALMIFEGGFSLASNVALFKPFSNNDYDNLNGILSATRRRFIVVGIIVFLIGIILSIIYPFAASSNMPKLTIAILMITALIPLSFNLTFSMKYRVLLLTDQKEYIISFVTTLTYLFGNCLAIALMKNGFSIVCARFTIMIFLLLNYTITILICRKRYKFINFHVKPDYESIKGTNNVILLKLTSVVYTSAPIVVLSIIPEVGAVLASVYAVYKSIVSVVKDSLISITNAPRLSFGALFAEERTDDAKELYGKYELITCIVISIILGTTCLLLIPFVELYTTGVTDVNYLDKKLAIIMLVTVFIEILHIPSGQMIQMKGDFKISKNIQTVAFIILVISISLGAYFLKLYGVVLAILLAAIALAFLEILYNNTKIFKRSFSDIMINLIPCAIICLICGYIGLNNYIKITSYANFIWIGLTTCTFISLITIIFYCLVQFKNMKNLYNYIIKHIFK